MANTELPRGIRNNNPGNIRKSKDKWQGLANIQPDREFFTFTSLPYGIRAMARILIKYQDDYGCDTVQKFIARYAPANENNTGAYARYVAAHMGVDVNETIDVHQYHYLRPMLEAMIAMENRKKGGDTWATWMDNATLDKGLVLAGIEAPKKPLQKTRTIKGAQIAAISTAGTAITEAVTKSDLVTNLADVQGQLAPLIEYSEWIKYAFLALALAGILLTVWARVDDRRKGIN